MTDKIIFLSILLIINIILLIVFYVKITLKLDESYKETMDTMSKNTQWLFNSLYAISPKVKSPETKMESSENYKATVIKPKSNGMDEFNGLRDDFHD